jgi:hypothetical protein
MSWAGITGLCKPTLHDKVLNARIAGLAFLSPASIRAVARQTAAEGLAGEHAMAAARMALDTDLTDKQTMNRLVLLTLARQLVRASPATSAAPEPDPRKIDLIARQTVALLAPHLGQPVAWVMGALDAIAETAADLGIAIGGQTGRIPRMLKLLGEVRDEIDLWGKAQTVDDRTLFVRMVSEAANVTLSLAAATYASALAVTDDMVALLRRWANAPDKVIRLIARPEWLLDGWEQICLIWRYARDDAARRAALAEIADRIPVLPREASEWSGYKSDVERLFVTPRPMQLNEDWRTGVAVLDLIDRNERFRGFAA